MFGSMFKTFEYLVKPNPSLNGVFITCSEISHQTINFQDIDLTPAFGNNTSSSDFSSEEESTPKVNKKLLRDPMRCNNVLEDIISYEKEAERLDQERKYIENLNKQGYLVGNNGEIFPVPKFKEPIALKKRKDAFQSVLKNTNNNNFQNDNFQFDDFQRLEEMLNVLSLLNLTLSKEDNEILEHFLNHNGDVPVICNSRQIHSKFRKESKCSYNHPNYCKLCITECPICFYLKLKEFDHNNRLKEKCHRERLTYTKIIELMRIHDGQAIIVSACEQEASRIDKDIIISNQNKRTNDTDEEKIRTE